MSTNIPFILKDNEVTVFVGGKVYVVSDSHVNYEAIRLAIRTKDGAAIERLVDIPKSIEVFSNGKVKVEHGTVYHDGEPLHNAITARILGMMQDGFDITPMVIFLENLMENPDYRAVNELYGFLEATDLPITHDGHFIAYKMVTNDYKDHRTHTMDNSVGATVSMPRNKVDPDKERTCSEGLHFCSQNYLGKYASSGRVVTLKINPKDVVAIPVDYNNAKGRACSYQVIGEVDASILEDGKHSFGTSVYGDAPKKEPEVSTTSSATVMLPIDEAAPLLCPDAQNPVGALRRRAQRGTVGSQYVDGVLHVAVPAHLAPKTDSVKLLTVEDAAEVLCPNALNKVGALRKKLARGTVKYCMVNGVQMVVVANDVDEDEVELISKTTAAGRLGLTRDELFDCIDFGVVEVEDKDGKSHVRWYVNKPYGGYEDIAEVS